MDLTSVFAAFGLSGAAGLNAWLPGGATVEAVHAGRSAIRPASTATTGGVGNPLLSLIEDVGSGLLTVFAFVVPVLAITALVGLVAGLVIPWRRVPRPTPRPPAPHGP
jgi:hypothetical protein